MSRVCVKIGYHRATPLFSIRRLVDKEGIILCFRIQWWAAELQ